MRLPDAVLRGFCNSFPYTRVAHFENVRRRALEHVWNFADGADIGGDILAFITIAARCRLDELAAFIAQ